MIDNAQRVRPNGRAADAAAYAPATYPSPYLAAARRWASALALATILAGAAGYASAATRPTVYTAQARLLVGQLSGDWNAIRASAQAAQTYAALASSSPVLDTANTAPELEGKKVTADDVEAASDDVTRLLTIRVRAADPASARIAVERIVGELQRMASQGPPEAGVAVVEPAGRGVAESGRAPLTAAAAALRGVLVALADAGAASRLRTGSRERGAAQADDPSMAMSTEPSVSAAQRPGGAQPVVVTLPEDMRRSDAFRRLVSTIDPPHGIGVPAFRTVVVAGGGPGDDDAVLATELASALASLGRRVRLVDANPAGGGISDRMGLAGRAGVSDLLLGHTFLREDGYPLAAPMFQRSPWAPGVDVLPAGRSPGDTELDARRAGTLLGSLMPDSDVVIVHAGSVGRSAAAPAWARAADGTVLVVGDESDPAGHAAAAALHTAGANLLGTVAAHA